MSSECPSLTTLQKLCVINFDEKSINSNIIRDKSEDIVIGPYSKTQVVVANDLYDVDIKLRKDLLIELITVLEAAGYLVCAIVCDLGGTNGQLLKDLGTKVSLSRTYLIRVKSNVKYGALLIH